MKIAFIFPGQGSQSLGMSDELADAYPIVKQTYAEASEALGYDLWNIVSNGPEEKLNDTTITQPAMLAAGYATWRVWQENKGPIPGILAGHSLGEYTALVCANSITFTDAIALVADRGRFMQAAVPAGEGAMAAILGLDDDVVRQACDNAAEGDVVSAVNFNSPGQVVIAGQAAAVERAVEKAKAAGAKRAVVLSVSVPSHCQLMQPAARQLAERLQGINIKSPDIPVINNVDVKSEQDPDAIRDALIRQLYCPVRWVEIIEKIRASDVGNVIECGPGKVLTGLNKRIDRQLLSAAIFTPDSIEQTLQAVKD